MRALIARQIQKADAITLKDYLLAGIIAVTVAPTSAVLKRAARK
jgi:hypothetical protein